MVVDERIVLTGLSQQINEAMGDLFIEAAESEENNRFTTLWLKECHRVLKNSGSICGLSELIIIFFFRVGTILQNIGFWILNDIIWIKTNPMLKFKGTRFNNAHETLC